MAKKKISDAIISFEDDMSAENVTGSCTYLEFPNTKVLLECGMYQNNNVKTNYKINNRKFKFKPREIDYVILPHLHADHCGLIPRLVADGFIGRLIIPVGSTKILYEMLSDSAYLNIKDAEYLNRKYDGKNFTPLYIQEHVDTLMGLIEEFPFGQRLKVNGDFDLEFLKSGHIINSASAMVYLNHGSSKKIYYTSDIGSKLTTSYYADSLEKIDSATVVISEATYSGKDRRIKKGDREKDEEKIKSIVDMAIERNGKIVIPAFSLNRTQDMLTFLCEMDIDKKIDIYVDSPLSHRVSKIYSSQYDKFKDVQSRVKWVVSQEDSMALMGLKKPHIVVSASGMCTGGRVLHHLKNALPSKNNFIVFCGFAVEGSLAHKIKTGNQKTITIHNKRYKNSATAINLKSFSSHIQRDELLDYLSGINCEKIVLKHSEMSNKLEFAEDLKLEISKKARSSRVICANKSTILRV